MRYYLEGFTALLVFSGYAIGQLYHGPEDLRIKIALTLETPSTGVHSSLNIMHLATQLPPIQTTNGMLTPGKDPASHIWIPGRLPAFGEPVKFSAGPKVISVNITTNEVQRIYPLGNVNLSASLLDDIRFNPRSGKAYLTDAGIAAIIILDLALGNARRVLNNALSTKEYMPGSAEGQLLRMNGKPLYVYTDQLEVSPDGKYLYFQPASGGMSRIETALLDVSLYNSSLIVNSTLEQFVEPYAHTPSTGGTAVDAHGNIYNSGTDRQGIIKIAPNGTMTTLVQDPRLLWVDAMWIDCHGKLWMPAAQLNRGEPFNDGKSLIVKPLYVYTIDIGVGPPAIDHA
ncbi:major royal jelly protein [Acrodontium crateriforme]|uniref:Major royal jelly protein n=1 Tax=Acrodontium crateriforme TaxID=150365 RepID=A0AAQ3M2N8_9PEZI|nr:major royal jelly protein [Acrodontium crateriforme]